MRKKITFKGNPLTLSGRILKPGDLAPDFKVLTQDLKEFSLFSCANKIKLISSFPSLDTEVCDLQVKEFNKRATEFSNDLIILGISKDLPFAQKRFCSTNNINNEIILSDYKYSSFGINYGVLIKELALLSRAVFIIDKNNIVRYVQIVEELTNPPDYQNALTNLKKIINSPDLSENKNSYLKCSPCDGRVLSLPKNKIEQLIVKSQGWNLIEDKKLVKEFQFSNFADTKWFADVIAAIAEEQGHHPIITITYGKLKITLTTHAAGGLTENDFIMANIINEASMV